MLSAVKRKDLKAIGKYVWRFWNRYDGLSAVRSSVICGMAYQTALLNGSLKDPSFESCPLAELSDAVNYIFGETIRFESKDAVRAFLKERLKPENTNKTPEPHKKR